MNDRTIDTTPAPETSEAGKSIQAYIDERPIWSDGTAVGMTPMTAMQWRILGLAAAGKFFEGFVVFMTGVALPLIAVEYNINAFEHGLVSAASLACILIGTLFLGGLADRFGRKPVFNRRDGDLSRVPVPAGRNPAVRPQFICAVGVLRRCARLRLSDRAPDPLREHPEHRSRPAGSGRVRVPGAGRADRHRGRRAFRIETTGVNLEKIGY